MRPTTEFGETFQYSNALVSAGGYVAAHILFPDQELGGAYDVAMQERIFDPIGMESTTFDFDVVAQGEHALPHGMNYRMEQQAMPLNIETWVSAVKPAGGAWSTTNDMARYLLMELAGGQSPTAKGDRVVSTENLRLRYEPQVKISQTLHYGLGMMAGTTKDVPYAGHDGGTLGFSTTMFLFPEHQVGMIILTNAVGTGFMGSVRQRLMELIFDAEEQAFTMVQTRMKQREQQQELALKLITPQVNREWVAPYVGSFVNPGLGAISLGWQDEALILDVREWASALGMRTGNDNVSTLILLDPPLSGMEFNVGGTEDAPTLSLSLGQHTYTFHPTQIEEKTEEPSAENQ